MRFTFMVARSANLGLIALDLEARICARCDPPPAGFRGHLLVLGFSLARRQLQFSASMAERNFSRF